MQRRSIVLAFSVYICPFIDKQFSNIDKTFFQCYVQWWYVIFIFGVDIRALLYQQLCHCNMLILQCIM